MKWIRQEHTNGCVLASLAMVTSRTYASIHDELAPQIPWYDSSEPYPETDEEREARWHRGIDFSKRSFCLDDAYRWLELNGYATQMRYRYRWGRDPVEWPPAPFAPVHIASVRTPSDTFHAIVMADDGSILDPNREPGTWQESFAFYREVQHVCGIYKVGA